MKKTEFLNKYHIEEADFEKTGLDVEIVKLLREKNS